MLKTSLGNIKNAPHFAALRHTDYRHIWTANMFSGASMWTFIVASAWLVLNKSDSSGWVGIITFALEVLGIRYLKDEGVISGAASAKNTIGYAMGW